MTVSPLAEGGNIEYVMIGWTGSSTTLDAAIASGSAFIGESKLYTGIATGDPLGLPESPTLMAASFTGLTLAPIAGAIPEPTTFALAGLGAVMLFLFRRRRQSAQSSPAALDVRCSTFRWFRGQLFKKFEP